MAENYHACAPDDVQIRILLLIKQNVRKSRLHLGSRVRDSSPTDLKVHYLTDKEHTKNIWPWCVTRDVQYRGQIVQGRGT
jgi:hypothetical protein